MAAKKVWVVEQQWDIGTAIVPVRSVVKAKTRAEAATGAPAAVRRALAHLLSTEMYRLPGNAVGKPVVLYAAGPGEMLIDD